jgi:hypothetical protein
LSDREVFYDKLRKELQDFPRYRHPRGYEIGRDESEVRLLFRNFGISNCPVLKPGDRVEGSNRFAT